MLHVRRPPTALLSLTNLRSCCATCPIRRREPESGAGQGRGRKSTSARNARPRCVVPSKKCSQPMKLHGLVNRPSRSDRKEPGDRNREVCCALERVVLRVENGMKPVSPYQFGERKSDVVPNHFQPVKNIGPARQQRPPASSQNQTCNVHHAIQHE